MPIVDANSITYDKPGQSGIVDASTIKYDEAPPPDSNVIPRTLGQRLLSGAGKNIGQMASGMYQLGKAGLETYVGMPEGAESFVQMGKGVVQQVKEIPGEVKELAKEPSAIPGKALDYVIDNPINAAMMLSGGLGTAGKVAGVAGMAKTAGALGKAAELVNPFSLAGKGVAGVVNKVGETRLPEALMRRSMKIPPGSESDEVVQDVLNTMVRKERLPLTENTLSMMNSRISQIENDTQAVFKNLSSPELGQGTEIDINKAVDALDQVKADYKNRGRPAYYQKAVERVQEDYTIHDFIKRQQIVTDPSGTTTAVPTGKATLYDANQLKKGIYEEIGEYYKKGQKPETGRTGIQNQAEARAKAKLAYEIKDAILQDPSVPKDVKFNMKKEAGLMNARKWVERALNREMNKDPLSLPSLLFGIMVHSHIPAAVAYKIGMSQKVLSRVAVGLAKGSRTGIGALKTAVPAIAGAEANAAIANHPLRSPVEEQETPPPPGLPR